MNTPENKHLLWELTKDLYSPGLERNHVIELFESTVAEVDESSSASLLEKNKTFFRFSGNFSRSRIRILGGDVA